MTDTAIVESRPALPAQTEQHIKRLESLEDAMRASPETLHELQYEHYFAKGIYGRVMKIPAGVVACGMIHKEQTLNLLIQGELSMVREDGEVVRIKAPYIVVSEPGTKRAAFAHEDSAWITIMPTEETDIEKIVAMFGAETLDDYNGRLLGE